jgi:flagellar motor switch protein FliM
MAAPDPIGSSAEVLTQADVERLLAQVKEAQNASAAPSPSVSSEPRSPDGVQPYDFRQPAFLTGSELRKLRVRHEEFLRSLAARLSIYLRMEFAVQMSKLQTVLFQKFTEGLPHPTHVVLFKIEPLRGICLLEIPPRLGLTIVDRLLGGPAQSTTTGRDLSDIEVSLLDQAVQTILREWCGLWTATHQDARPAIIGHENNARFLQTAPRDAVMLVIGLEARLGDCMEQMQLAIPFYTLEPLIRTPDVPSKPEHAASPPAPAPARWQSQFDDVRIPVTAVWPEQEITLRDLASLKVGDVLLMDDRCSHQVNLRLARIERFAGRLGTRGKAWAVEITQALPT